MSTLEIPHAALSVDAATPAVPAAQPSTDESQTAKRPAETLESSSHKKSKGNQESRFKGRRREDHPEREPSVSSDGPREDKVPKKRVALLVGYTGTGFSGLQKNPGVTTVESTLEEAIFRAGGMLESNFGDLSKVGWSRASRTDKGVHAAGQIISLKVLMIDNLVEKINAHLPKDIRVLGYVRTVNNFNPKNGCDGRFYEYLLPVSLCAPSLAPLATYNNASDPWMIDQATAARQAAGAENLTEAQVARLNAILATFVGSHNFHNFTNGRAANDPSCSRFIRSFKVAELLNVDGLSCARLVVDGQSFLLHQIRKMVALSLLVLRGNAPFSMIAASFGKERILLPLAPPYPLLLDQCYYSGLERSSSGEVHKLLRFENAADAKSSYKLSVIYPHIVALERSAPFCQPFLDMLDTMYNYTPNFKYAVPHPERHSSRGPDGATDGADSDGSVEGLPTADD